MSIKNPLFIGGAVAFLIVAGIAWNYTEAIKAKNEIERERIAEEKRLWDAEANRQANFQVAYIECIKEAQDKYDARATEGPIFEEGPHELMESKKRDCERLYGIK